MKFNMKNLDFRLFDESGDLGAEASAFLEANGIQDMQSEESQETERIEYGKGEEADSQVGSDEMKPADEFSRLISKGGEYHDIYHQHITEAIQNRFKNQADLQAQIDGLSESLSPLYLNYGIKPGDIEGLQKAIANDEKLYEQGAEREGLTPEQYKENLRLQAEAERGRAITEAYEQQQRENAMFEQWETEAVELQTAFPNFDLGLEIESNEEFAKLITSGVDVRTAFISTHMDDILSGASAEASKQATEKVVSTIQSRANRPTENGIRHNPAIQRKSDPNKLSNTDIDEIMKRVESGESISF